MNILIIGMGMDMVILIVQLFLMMNLKEYLEYIMNNLEDLKQMILKI